MSGRGRLSRRSRSSVPSMIVRSAPYQRQTRRQNRACEGLRPSFLPRLFLLAPNTRRASPAPTELFLLRHACRDPPTSQTTIIFLSVSAPSGIPRCTVRISHMARRRVFVKSRRHLCPEAAFDGRKDAHTLDSPHMAIQRRQRMHELSRMGCTVELSGIGLFVFASAENLRGRLTDSAVHSSAAYSLGPCGGQRGSVQRHPSGFLTLSVFVFTSIPPRPDIRTRERDFAF